jgi:glycosyltransferase involved in cell wall biosynthesis
VRADPAEARALAFGARVALLPRRHAGGFPLKLLGYLEASVPVVAFADSAPTLAHGDSGWLLPDRAGDGELAEAVATLWKDGALAARLAAGGRRTLEAEHAWPALARRTLALARAASAPDPLEGRAHGVAQ